MRWSRGFEVSLRAITVGLALTLPVRADVPVPVAPRFVEETTAAGVSHSYTGDWNYIVGGGVAVFDCDDDGFEDMFLAGGSAPGSFWHNTSAVGGPLGFARRVSGLELDAVTGAWPLDVDGDGVTDLAMLRVGENVVMQGLGGCRFERANEVWGFAGGDAWSTAFAATWEPGAAWPTVAVGNYIDRTQDAFPWGSCTANWLHRPGATGFAPPLPLLPSHCPLSMLFTDWNRSGTPSLRVTNDREYYKGGQEQLWRMDPAGPPVAYGEADGWRPLKIWGMGIASQDLDFDGFPEYFLTSMADNKLQTLMTPAAGAAREPRYGDVALARGVTAQRPHNGGDVRPSTAWHAEFQDVNNDGRTDLFIAKGNVSEMPDFALHDPDNLLVQDAAGQFHETAAAAGVASPRSGRGAALADFNMDGLVDLVVVNRNEGAQVWRNTTARAGGFVAVRLRQPGPNTDAIGAWIEVSSGGIVQRREVTVGGGHAGGRIGWQHFGLGSAPAAAVRVIWPGGATGPWQTVAAGGFSVLQSGMEPRVVVFE